MQVEKVTREMLRSIEVGYTEEYSLPSAQACETAKATAYQLGRIDGTKYSAKTDFATNTVKITRLYDNN